MKESFSSFGFKETKVKLVLMSFELLSKLLEKVLGVFVLKSRVEPIFE